MGRIKTIAIKTLGNELIKEHGDKFTDDFGKNKEILSKIKNIKSKKIKNVVAGYITKEMKRISKSGL
ncbi:MAG: 30S ribosomal protein S17e [Candidatus Aenigmarchaeota archaeon]|nr:30S ribosomal protein S17e [Candidatus Aenigmarchaeota archaeon]MCK4531630.1 30S ribosomal protein S17e [Candidatus Aenigmarchaeota archaeon]